jgi:hypothetical protein
MDKFHVLRESDFDKYEYNLDELISQFTDEKLNGDIYITLRDEKYAILQSIVNCESPIEQAFAFAMHFSGFQGCIYFNPDVDIVAITNQPEITCGNKKYRVDFEVSVWYTKLNKAISFVVECDGHEFHEKTKEQVAKNNKRDRDLISEGYQVVHFSGSEIYNSAYRCVKELLKLILSFNKSEV